jgi:SAM-dependent methyltransferase
MNLGFALLDALKQAHISSRFWIWHLAAGFLGANYVDALNRKTMQSVVHEYRWTDDLETHEIAALSVVSERVRNGRILDIGVGAGRTVKGLRQISEDYLGVDYVREMVDYCRAQFPGIRFEHADARAMPQFADQSFDLIVFACNGICMVDHAGRLAILREVYRLLAPGGFFVFSTSNLNWPDRDALLALPAFRPSGHPVRLLTAGARFVMHTGYRIINRFRYKRHEIKTAEYEILNDRCHDYRTMIYFTTMENQQRQLRDVGFSRAQVFDLSGKTVAGDTRDGTITFVAAK